MPDYLAPGVYVEEIPGPRAIAGVPTGVAAFLGETAKGPRSPRMVTSLGDYERTFGATAVRRSAMPFAVRAYFDNGGSRLWVVRIRGNGGPPSLADYLGEPERRVNGRLRHAYGLAALAEMEDVDLVAAPGAAIEVQRALVADSTERGDRVAILDGPRAPWSAASLDPAADGLRSSHAAIYVPWLEMAEASGRTRMVPPSGAVCGIIARVDAQRGVWKAPANETVRGVLGMDKSITNGEQELLNPRGLNCIRDFPGRGTLLWGARTLSGDAEWRYLSVRRLAIFLEQSIQRGLQWVVFEPNGEPLWAQMRGAIANFLQGMWREGALAGSRPDESFFVRCDRTTMTQSDIDAGRLICEIGFAPLKPAEFVIVRIGWPVGGV